ncbi:transposase [Streptomyces sp. NBC_01205]
MAQTRVPRRIGRPTVAPDVVLADKAYSSRAIRGHLRRRGVRVVIPQPAAQAANPRRLGRRRGCPPAFDREADKQRNTVERCINKLKQRRGLAIPERVDQARNRARRGSLGGRPPAFDRETYKYRNVVERCFNRLKQWRGIATRYDKTAQSYQAAVTLASLLMWA